MMRRSASWSCCLVAGLCIAAAGSAGRESPRIETYVIGNGEAAMRDLEVVVIDLARYKIKAVSAHSVKNKKMSLAQYYNALHRRYLEERRQNPKAVEKRDTLRGHVGKILEGMPEATAAMNASFFIFDTGEPIGILVEDGELVPTQGDSSLDAIFYSLKDGTFGVLARDRFVQRFMAEDYDPVYGKKRLLLKKDSGVESAVGGKSDWTTGRGGAQQAVLCLSGSGKAVFATTRSGVDLDGVAGKLRGPLGCGPMVHLDGSGSAQLAVREGGRIDARGRERCSGKARGRAASASQNACFRLVPTFLVAVPRQ